MAPVEGAGDDRRLTRRIDLESTPSGVYDVDVRVVYADGTVETVDAEHLTVVDGGVRVEGHPLVPGRRVLRVAVDYRENVYPWTRLWAFLRRLPEATRETARAFRNRRD